MNSKSRFTLICIIAFLWADCLNLAAQTNAADVIPGKVPVERTSYALGVDLIRKFKRESIDYDLDQLIRGMKDAASGSRTELNEQEIASVINSFQTGLRERQASSKGQRPADLNRRRNESFLKANRATTGIITLTNGLQYYVMKSGTGRHPGFKDKVDCHYTVKKFDGTLVAATNPGKAETFGVSEAPLPGWREVLPLMGVGDRWRVYLPPPLAYGISGVPGKVPPNELIITEIEIAEIK